jgi:radical SAM superfamily enzyme YgiQ (UPF0313 family)
MDIAVSAATPITIAGLSGGRLLPEKPTERLSICILNPKFEPSYWGFDYALPLYPGNKSCTMTTGALAALAGMVPEGHQVDLLDENVEEIDFERLARYDIVAMTGMIVQKERMKEILLKLREMPPLVVVGGAYATVKEEFFDGLCDVLFVGEADDTWPQFLRDYAAGRPCERYYKQAERTDMTTVPKPRYDLLKVKSYASGSLQFSRGCPYRCEFCDIIVTFGRRPRVKRPEQVIAELEEMRNAGFFSCFIVDDNFVGNKREAKKLLELIIPWQERHGYPLRLTCEASMNLADDPQLLDLMYRANVRTVFIGIESPRAESLEETLKTQNTRGDSMEEKLARIQNAGLDINGGFIVGFDHDDKAIFEEQFNFIQGNGILLSMVGMLQAIPTTPLYERLEKEGRLVADDPNCNIIPKQMTREELIEGYWDLVQRLYTPEAFLDRYFYSYRYPEYYRKRGEISRKAREGKFLPTLAYGLILLVNLIKTLWADGSLRSIGGVYLKKFFRDSLRHRRDVIGFAQYMNRCVTHWHFYRFTREARAGKLRHYSSS